MHTATVNICHQCLLFDCFLDQRCRGLYFSFPQFSLLNLLIFSFSTNSSTLANFPEGFGIEYRLLTQTLLPFSSQLPIDGVAYTQIRMSVARADDPLQGASSNPLICTWPAISSSSANCFQRKTFSWSKGCRIHIFLSYCTSCNTESHDLVSVWRIISLLSRYRRNRNHVFTMAARGSSRLNTGTISIISLTKV